jgi:hypothetical protein
VWNNASIVLRRVALSSWKSVHPPPTTMPAPAMRATHSPRGASFSTSTSAVSAAFHDRAAEQGTLERPR